MLERTSLAEQEFNSLHSQEVKRLVAEIAELKKKLEERTSSLNWYQSEYYKSV
jgi:hypothetical protein